MCANVFGILKAEPYQIKHKNNSGKNPKKTYLLYPACYVCGKNRELNRKIELKKIFSNRDTLVLG